MAITASEAKNFVLCPRIVYLNIYGPRERKIPPTEFYLKKAEEGKEFESKVMSKISYVEPKCKPGDLKARIAATEGLMKAGAEIIYQGALCCDDLIGIPDMLEKRKGKSRFGDFYYTVAEIKTGLSVKEKYLMQVMFYMHMLSGVQGFLPPKAYMVLGDESRHEINVTNNIDDFRKKLDEIREIAKGKAVEPSRVSECPNCPWYDVCFEILLRRRDISLLYRLAKSDMKLLKKSGINDLEGVASINVEKAAREAGFKEPQLKKWKAQAKSWVEKKPVFTGEIKFPEKKAEIFLDFESEDQLHYLIGVLAREKSEKVIQFVAHTREDEKKAWKDFLDFVSGYDDFVIYHYGSYERKALRQLIERYGISRKLQDKIFGNMFDLLKVFYEKVMLPTWSYSLKPVANYLGFEWRNHKASGEVAMLWYDSYIKTKDKKFINMIKEYNEDDLTATRLIKDWLAASQDEHKKAEKQHFQG